MVIGFRKPLLNRLDDRRQALGLSVHDLATRSGLSMMTVNRILSGNHPNASWANVLAIARALGLDVEFNPSADVEELREQQAARKADELTRMIQGTSALEAQALDPTQLDQMRRRIARELLTGSNRMLWPL
jgi:transcriptional regulator with XRE-family HTH domain